MSDAPQIIVLVSSYDHGRYPGGEHKPHKRNLPLRAPLPFSQGAGQGAQGIGRGLDCLLYAGRRLASCATAAVIIDTELHKNTYEIWKSDSRPAYLRLCYHTIVL